MARLRVRWRSKRNLGELETYDELRALSCEELVARHRRGGVHPQMLDLTRSEKGLTVAIAVMTAANVVLVAFSL
jgi:hypothetical protein